MGKRFLTESIGARSKRPVAKALDTKGADVARSHDLRVVHQVERASELSLFQ